MGPGAAAGYLLLCFTGFSTAFHSSLLRATGPQLLANNFHDEGISSARIRWARPAVRSGAAGVLQATVEGVSRTANYPEEDELEATPSEGNTVEWDYDWRKQWYGVGFECDFPKGEKPFGMTIFDEPLVLFRDGEGILHCVSDFCPHRASTLSGGMVTDGNIECLYHGWQFDGKTGSCVHVPQLPEGAKPPRAANLRVYPLAIREGMVYVWMGDDPWGEGAKDILPVPCTKDDLDKNKPGFRLQFAYDFPIDWSYLVENTLDPAHLFFSHHGVESGGNRAAAGPISFEVVKEGPEAPSSRGFTAKVRNLNFTKRGTKRVTTYRFEAPGVVYMRVQSGSAEDKPEDGKKPGMLVGVSVHTVPLGRRRSRALIDTYGLNVPLVLKLLIGMKPKFLRNLHSCMFGEQDLPQIYAQEDHMIRTGKSASQSYRFMMSSDRLAVELRKWLDHVGHGMPYYTGWKTSKSPVEQLSDHEITQDPKHRAKESRFYNHVVLSESSRTALKNIIKVKRASMAAAGILATTALLIPYTVGAASPVAAGAAVRGFSKAWWAGIATAISGVVALGLSAAAQKLEGHYYKNFERHPVL